MALELQGVRECKWNFEHPLILMACILHCKQRCTQAKDIKKHIVQCLDLWHQEKVVSLIHDITTTSLANAGYRSATNDAETMARKYNATVLDGRLRTAVRGLVSTDGGGVLSPDDSCTKTGCLVWDVLAENIRPCKSQTYQTPTTSHSPTKAKHWE